MKIAIMVPMLEEREYYEQKFTMAEKLQFGTVEVEHFTHGNNEIFMALSGIGKVQAAMALTAILATQEIDLIFISGSAGSLTTNVNIGDVIVASEFAYHDVDATSAGEYVVGQVPSEPARFDLRGQYFASFTTFLDQEKSSYHEGLIVTGDTFVASKKVRQKILESFPDALGTEMEGAAFAQVAKHFEVPMIGLRAISDNGDENADFDFDQFVKKAGENTAKLIIKFLETDVF